MNHRTLKPFFPRSIPGPHFSALLRGTVVLALSASLGGCAVWNSVFGSDASGSKGADGAAGTATAPAAVPDTAPAPASVSSPAASAPVAVEPAPASTAQAAPVHTPTVLAQPAPAAEPPMPASPPQSHMVTPSPVAAAASAAKAAAHGAGKGVPGAPGYHINVGLFALAANASRASAQLSAAAQPVYSETVRGKKGTLTRVRVGPFPTRTQADKAAQKIKAMGLDAVVFHRR